MQSVTGQEQGGLFSNLNTKIASDEPNSHIKNFGTDKNIDKS